MLGELDVKKNCGCKIVNGQITELCEESKAGWGLVHLSKQVDGNGKYWENLIKAKLMEHAKQLLDGKEKKKQIIHTSED